MAKDVTTIRVSTELRDRLKELGKKGETYDEIIERLLNIAVENRGGKN
jgi:predicted DNA-binding protein